MILYQTAASHRHWVPSFCSCMMYPAQHSDTPDEAIGPLTAAIYAITQEQEEDHVAALREGELAALLLSRSQAHFDCGSFKASLADALAALCVTPTHPTATFRACEAFVQLGRLREACAVLSAGAAHTRDEALYDFFCKRARSLGSWRLPPPLDLEGLHRSDSAPSDRPVPRLQAPTRDQFALFAARRKPCIVHGFAPSSILDEWSWEALIHAARGARATSSTCVAADGPRPATTTTAAKSRPSGDVTVTSTGCLPDYCRPEASGDDAENPLASRIPLMHFEDLEVGELLWRVAFSPPGAPRDDRTPLNGETTPHRLRRGKWREAALRAAQSATAETRSKRSVDANGAVATSRCVHDFRCDRNGGCAGGRGGYGGMLLASACSSRRSWGRESYVSRRQKAQQHHHQRELAVGDGQVGDEDDGYAPTFDKYYAYGGDWMLTIPRLREMASRVRPTFLNAADYERGRRLRGFSDLEPREYERKTSGDAAAAAAVSTTPDVGGSDPGVGAECNGHPSTMRQLVGSRAFVPLSSEDDGAVCWVSSAGCLTPLHYDLDDGLLVQVIGEKRVWLYDNVDRASLYMRGDVGKSFVDAKSAAGRNNWERQSQAEMHGSRRAAFPLALAAERWVADLKPGELLYIPAGWFHEVHSRTPSFSLGWRISLTEPSDSEGRLRRVLDSARASCGAKHEETHNALRSLGRFLFHQGRFAEAEPLHRELLHALSERHGSESEEAILERSNLGLCNARLGRLDESAQLIAAAHEGLKRRSAHDPRVASLAASLAEIRHRQGRLQEAEALYREALEGRRANLGEAHPMTVELVELLASPLRARSRAF